METKKTSGIIFLIFLIISLLPAPQASASFVSPFFLNEAALTVWGIITFFQHKSYVSLVIAGVFTLGAVQNVYLLQYLDINPGEQTVTYLWASFTFLLMGMLLVGILYSFMDFKKKTLRDQIFWILYILVLIALFVLITYDDSKWILIAFVAQMAILLSLLMNISFKPYVLIWEAWLLYSVLEIMKTLSLLEAA